MSSTSIQSMGPSKMKVGRQIVIIGNQEKRSCIFFNGMTIIFACQVSIGSFLNTECFFKVWIVLGIDSIQAIGIGKTTAHSFGHDLGLPSKAHRLDDCSLGIGISGHTICDGRLEARIFC
mmetsp:Transcript_88185/g.254346  ORF Transcript_88185/g.254346 Transcript_88185/m.254346 type:complete len:120 (+) Transcript_88185:120-479(+)